MVKIQVNSQGKAYYTSGGKALVAPEGGTPVITSLSVTPTTSSQTITAPSGTDGYSPVNVSAVTSSIDANIQAGNIKKDVQILGVTGTYEGSGGGSKYGATAGTFLGNVNANGVLQLPTEQSDLVFTGVKDVANFGLHYRFMRTKVKSASFPSLTTISGNSACYYMLQNCTALTSVSFPSLTTISGSSACYFMLYSCIALTSVSFPSLTTISGDNACYYMLSYCTSLTSVSFPKLTTISGSKACGNMLQNCKALTNVYFPALTTTSFSSRVNQFNMMMSDTGTKVTHTLHFPSNLESKIQTLTGYPTFGGTSGYVVLAFDLPQTN